MKYIFNDGGRKAAGFRGKARDCVCRAAAIVTGRPYKEVYDLINQIAKGERFARGRLGYAAATGRGSGARTGVHMRTTAALMAELGLVWVPTMKIGSGCTVHLREGELPKGRIIASVSKHVVAVIDGVIHDNHDPQRGGTRCVYGYWRAP